MNDFGSNAGKAWLYRLPNQTDPIPEYETRTDGMILVFLIFQPRPGLPYTSEYVVKSACHARRTWIMNSDAVDLGVPCKFYVEESEKGALAPIFDQNGIDMDRDIIYFTCPDETAPTCNQRDYHRKKMSFVKDSQFENYKWTLVCDSDLFIARGLGWNDQKLSVFERLASHKSDPGILRITDRAPNQVEKWMNRCAVGSFEENREAWFDIIKGLVDPEHYKKIRDNPFDLVSPACALHLFPSAHFMKEKKSDCEWLYNAAQHLDSDEAMMALYDKGDGDIWDFHREFGIRVVYLNQEDSRREHVIYLSHPINQSAEAGQSEELNFRQSIGVE